MAQIFTRRSRTIQIKFIGTVPRPLSSTTGLELKFLRIGIHYFDHYDGSEINTKGTSILNYLYEKYELLKTFSQVVHLHHQVFSLRTSLT